MMRYSFIQHSPAFFWLLFLAFNHFFARGRAPSARNQKMLRNWELRLREYTRRNERARPHPLKSHGLPDANHVRGTFKSHNSNMLPSTPLRGTFFTTFPSPLSLPLVSLPFPYFPSFLHAYAYYPLRAFPLFFPACPRLPLLFSLLSFFLLLLLSFLFVHPEATTRVNVERFCQRFATMNSLSP